jgi:C4-dicarboxylate transporter DctM subunit
MTLLLIILLLVLVGAKLFVIVGTATALAFVVFTPDHQTLESLIRIVNKMEGLTTKNVFLSIPFFIGAGVVMTQGGIARRLIDVARAITGWMPGGLAVATVIACVIFAAISGSSPVTLIAVGVIMFPALSNSKYPENFSLGLITTAGSLGCLVPPSIAMLIYAISVSGRAAVDPADLFLAGLVPALLIAGLLCMYAMWIGRSVPGAREPFSLSRLGRALREGGFALVLPVLVLGGIYSGTFTPTEAGAVALVYAVFVTVFVHRDLQLGKLPALLAESSTLIGSLILIVVLSFGLNDFLAEIEAAEFLVQKIEAADLSPFGFFLVVNAILIVLGALMDSISATLIFAPILAPIALEVYGIDPLHFGVVFVVNMEIGYLAPPIATNLFVASAVFKRPFGQVTRAVLPTLAIVCGALLALMYVPTFSKAAVNWKRDQPIYQAFPWTRPVKPQLPEEDSDIVGGPSPAAAAPTTPGGTAPPAPFAPALGPGGERVKSLEEMMNEADEAAEEEEPVEQDPKPDPGKAPPPPTGAPPQPSGAP